MSHIIPPSVRSKLWKEATDQQLFVILDGAQNPGLLEVMDASPELEVECLMMGKLEPDMQEVAPYIVQLHEEAPFTQWIFDNGWGQNWGIFLVSKGDLGDVWRHMRGHVRVFGPNRERLFFRYYDPRVLNAFLPTCDAVQLAGFFGDVGCILAEAEDGAVAHCYSMADGQLVNEVVKAR